MTSVQRCLRHPINRHMAGCPDCVGHLLAQQSPTSPTGGPIPAPRTALTLVRAA